MKTISHDKMMTELLSNKKNLIAHLERVHEDLLVSAKTIEYAIMALKK